MDRFLSIPEIFESILLQLPLADLLRYQRVSKLFKAIIEGSPALQQALFFRAKPVKTGTPVEINSLLAKQFPYWFPNADLERHEHGRIVFARLNGDSETQDKRGTGNEWKPDARIQDAILRKEASWRRMFPTQPPVAVLTVCDTVSARGGGYVSSGNVMYDVANGDGLRMADLYDLAEEYVFCHLVAHFQVAWDLPSLVPNIHRSEKILHTNSTNSSPSEGPEETRSWVTLSRRMVVQCTRRQYSGEPIFRSRDYRKVAVGKVREWQKPHR